MGRTSPGSGDGTTPFGVGNAMWHGPGVVRQPAQPRAVWHNAVGVWEGNRGWTQMGRVGGFAILGKSRNGNRISRRAAEALRGGIRVLCGSASLRDTFSAGGCVGRLGVVDFVWPVLKMCPDNSWNPVRIETERCPIWFGLLSDLPRNTNDGWDDSRPFCARNPPRASSSMRHGVWRLV